MGSTKSAKIDLRTLPQHKALIRRAAEKRGKSMTAFCVQAALQEATAALASREDSEQGADHASA